MLYIWFDCCLAWVLHQKVVVLKWQWQILLSFSHLFGCECGDGAEAHHFNFRHNVFHNTDPFVSWCLKHLSIQLSVCVCALHCGVPASWGYPPSSVVLFPVLSLSPTTVLLNFSLHNCSSVYFQILAYRCHYRLQLCKLMVLQAVTLYGSTS